MKKITIILSLISSLLFLNVSHAVEPKMRVIATMSGYGVVGGALLGTASMAFGASSRAIAKGASLGLYGGLLFGTYVVLSYEMKKRGYDTREDYYPDSRGQYDDSRSEFILPDLREYRLAGSDNKRDPKKDPIFEFNFLSLNF